MSITRAALRQLAKALAQDGGPSNTAYGVQLLLSDPGDYNTAIAQALAQFALDQPNRRVVDCTVVTAGFRFPLSGANAILPVNPSAPDLPSVALAAAGAGNVNTGAHRWVVTGVYDIGETEASEPSTLLTVVDQATNGKVNLVLNDPTVTDGFHGFNIFRTEAGGTDYKRVAFVSWANDVSETTPYQDNISDTALGAAPPTASTALDPDAWMEGASSIVDLWFPFDATTQGLDPNDQNSYRTRPAPGGLTVLEFLADLPQVGDIIRVEFTKPHQVDETEQESSTIPAGLREAMVALSAAMILQMAANKAVQNTGNTGLPNDVVDRRTQSDIFRSRAKELLTVYNTLVGKATTENIKGASGFLDLDVEPSYRFGGLGGFMWHDSRNR